MIPDLNDSSFLMLAMKSYETKNFLMSEFEEDLKRIKYLKRLFKKFQVNKNLKDRLILNHIIILGNTFGIEFTTRMLFFKIDPRDWSLLKTFLVFLNMMPELVLNVNSLNIRSSDIPVNMDIAKTLRMI